MYMTKSGDADNYDKQNPILTTNTSKQNIVTFQPNKFLNENTVQLSFEIDGVGFFKGINIESNSLGYHKKSTFKFPKRKIVQIDTNYQVNKIHLLSDSDQHDILQNFTTPNEKESTSDFLQRLKIQLEALQASYKIKANNIQMHLDMLKDCLDESKSDQK